MDWFEQNQRTNLTLHAATGMVVDAFELVESYPDWYMVYMRATLPKDTVGWFERVMVVSLPTATPTPPPATAVPPTPNDDSQQAESVSEGQP